MGLEVGLEVVLLFVELLLGGEQLLYSLGFGLLVPVVGGHLYLDLAFKVDIVREIQHVEAELQLLLRNSVKVLFVVLAKKQLRV